MQQGAEELQNPKQIAWRMPPRSYDRLRDSDGFSSRRSFKGTSPYPARGVAYSSKYAANLSISPLSANLVQWKLKSCHQERCGVVTHLDKFASFWCFMQLNCLQSEAALESGNPKVASNEITPVTEQRRCRAA